MAIAAVHAATAVVAAHTLGSAVAADTVEAAATAAADTGKFQLLASNKKSALLRQSGLFTCPGNRGRKTRSSGTDRQWAARAGSWLFLAGF